MINLEDSFTMPAICTKCKFQEFVSQTIYGYSNGKPTSYNPRPYCRNEGDLGCLIKEIEENQNDKP